MAISKDNYYFPVIDSTNTWAKANVRHLHRERITIIAAAEQTAGRGRQERLWLSPPDVNLYASYCFFVPKDRKDIANVPQVIAVATMQQLSRYDLSPLLKWPNDILINGKKVGGILTETVPLEDTIGVITGLGLNINMTSKDLSWLKNPATSLSVEAGHAFEIDSVSDDLQNAVCSAIETYLEKGFKPFLIPFREFLAHRLGDTLRFHVGQQLWQGSFHSINDDGSLNLILDDRMQSFHSGEIV